MTPWLHTDDVSAGDVVYLDDAFDCHMAGPVLLHADENGNLYFKCKGHAAGRWWEFWRWLKPGTRHYVDGQDDGDGRLVGIMRAP